MDVNKENEADRNCDKETRSTQPRNSICANYIRQRLPIITWLPNYTVSKGLQDALAGLTVGLTAIPQGIAYASVAGLEPQYGLYSSFMGCFLYIIFGSSKDINIGPTALMALLTHPHVEQMGPDMAVLLTFLSGCIVFLLGVFQLGFIIRFFSYPVISAFTSAAAIEIASTQLKGLFGLSGTANDLLEAWELLFENIKKTRRGDIILGTTCLILLIIAKEMSRLGSRKSRPEWSRSRNVLAKVIWLISLSRNAIIVISTTIIAWVLHNRGQTPFKLTGTIEEGLPPLSLPPFSTEFKNETYTFMDMTRQFGTSLAFIPLVALLEHVAIAKVFAHGKTVDATQEMLALGIATIGGSFVRSMPNTGSFSRTAINNSSGVRTPMGGLVCGTMVLLALGLLTSTFYYIPKASLAAVVIAAMIYIVEYEAVIILWKTNKLDLVPFAVTFFSSLFIGMEYGILIGCAVNLLFVMYTSAIPPVEVVRDKLPHGDIYLVTPCTSLQFPSAEYIREKVMRECNDGATVVIDGKYIRLVDATVAKNLISLCGDLKLRNQKVVLWNFKPSVKDTLVGLNKKSSTYFREGNLEDIVHDPAINRISTDVIYSIP